MRVLHGMAESYKELDPLPDGELLTLAILGDFEATHELHDEVRAAGIGCCGIEDTGNMRMIHEGEGLALVLEARDDLPCVHAELNDFEGDLAPDGGELLSQVNDATAAFAEFLDEQIGTDLVPSFFRDECLGGLVREREGVLENANRASPIPGRMRQRSSAFGTCLRSVHCGVGEYSGRRESYKAY